MSTDVCLSLWVLSKICKLLNERSLKAQIWQLIPQKMSADGTLMSVSLRKDPGLWKYIHGRCPEFCPQSYVIAQKTWTKRTTKLWQASGDDGFPDSIMSDHFWLACRKIIEINNFFEKSAIEKEGRQTGWRRRHAHTVAETYTNCRHSVRQREMVIGLMQTPSCQAVQQKWEHRERSQLRTIEQIAMKEMPMYM